MYFCLHVKIRISFAAADPETLSVHSLNLNHMSNASVYMLVSDQENKMMHRDNAFVMSRLRC